ncbi:MAG: hypothetical protein U9Q29_01390 [Campylobacterota bacterium]|nr:hypothetical protein [Campylobacterota bacterium]
MLSKLFESLYLKVFVNIIVLRAKSVVYIETANKKGIVDSVEESFNTTSLNDSMCDFILSYTSESPFNYISILDKSLSQGAAPTCSSKEISTYCDTSSSKHLCYGDKWSFYTSKLSLHAIEKEYSKTGVDFVFSPFVVLARFFRDKIDINMAMFILVEDNFVTLSVFDNSVLLYAKHLDMQHYKDSSDLLMDDEEEIELDIDDGIDLDSIEADDLDDFGDIEDLDSLEDLDEFSDAKDLDEEFQESLDETVQVKEVDGFNEDYQRYLLIQSSINDFYKSTKYKSQFIESTYIADGVGVSGDLKRYLEEEMFLNVYIRSMDLGAEICELAKAELK